MKNILIVSLLLFLSMSGSAQILFLNDNGIDFGMNKGDVAKALEGKYKLKQIRSVSVSGNSETFALDKTYILCKCNFEVLLNFESTDVLKSIYFAFTSADPGVFGVKEYKINTFSNPEPVFSYIVNCVKEKYGDPKPHGPIRMGGIKIEQWEILNTVASVYWNTFATNNRIFITFEK